MKLLTYFLACLLAMVTTSAAHAGAGDPILVDTKKFQSIGDQVDVLADSLSTYTINEVSQSNHFSRSTDKVPNLGHSFTTAWFRISFKNVSEANNLFIEIENPLLEATTLYLPSSNGFDSITIRKNEGFRSRPFPSSNFQFRLTAPRDSLITCYLRVVSNTQLQVPINLSSREELFYSNQNKELLTAIYIGIMMVMFLYNLFVYLSVRDRSYLYYILYILSVTLVQLNIKGFGYKYLWPGAPLFEKYAVYIFPSLTAFTSIAFIRHFLRTKEFTPRLHKGFWIFVVAYICTLAGAFAGFERTSYNFLNINALPLALYMIGTALYIWRKFQFKPAFYFLVAWTIFLVGIICFVLKDVGVFPYNLMTVSFIQIGSAIEAVLLSFALADKINSLKKEKEESQAEALRIAQVNERIIREQNVVLEARVNERTMELKTSNDDLNSAMTTLKEAQAQLVESEKMASLGQLTAGIAHEINNPINFVTSNIKPLRRDLDMLVDLFNQVEAIGLSADSQGDKQTKVNQLKEEYDFDYLKTEINFLLDGIADGSNRTAEIVKGLRIFSRLDEDDLKYASLSEGLDSTLVIVNNLMNSRVEVVRHYGDLPMVECYPGKLNQVFLNIITNAIHAIKAVHGDAPGGVLTLSTETDGQYAYVKIRDNGTGMSEATKHRLFEPFFTTKDVGEGTGLGLSIAYKTIQKHHAFILVDTKEGEGTEFTIKLPLVQPAAPAEETT
jgi:signal transduction histidine kinase